MGSHLKDIFLGLEGGGLWMILLLGTYKEGSESGVLTCLPGEKVADITHDLDRLIYTAGEESAVMVHITTNDIGK